MVGAQTVAIADLRDRLGVAEAEGRSGGFGKLWQHHRAKGGGWWQGRLNTKARICAHGEVDGELLLPLRDGYGLGF